jgi:hypothetical protein
MIHRSHIDINIDAATILFFCKYPLMKVSGNDSISLIYTSDKNKQKDLGGGKNSSRMQISLSRHCT